MSVLANIEYGWTQSFGAPFQVRLPIAASQTVRPGDMIYLSSAGEITRVAATTEAIDTGDAILGFMASDGYPMRNGVQTSLAVDTLVDVVLWDRNLYLNLPSRGTTPAKTNLGELFAGYNDAGVYKLDISNTTNGCFRIFAFDLKDALASQGTPKYKSTLPSDCRANVVILDAARQVIF